MPKFPETGLETLTQNCQNWTKIMEKNARLLNDTLLYVSGMADVEITSIADGDVLAYDADIGKMRNTPKASVIPSSTPKILGQFRERDRSSSYNPDFSFTKSDFGEILIASTGPSLGEGFLFFHVPRTYLHGKKLRITWEMDTSSGSLYTKFRVYDGKYERDVDADWGLENDTNIPDKGSGSLGTSIASHIGSFAKITETTDVLDTSAGVEDDVTVMAFFTDAWSGAYANLKITKLAILSSSDVELYEVDFTQPVTIEVTGTTGDYGYIGSGAVSTTTTTTSSSTTSSTQSTTSSSSSSSTTTTTV